MLAGCGSQVHGEALTFDPCGPVEIGAAGATDDQLAGIDAAIALWRADGVAELARGDAPEIAIVFRDAAEAMYGVYDDVTATIYINVRLVDPAQRTITVAHELGHALGLVHVAPDTRASVMNPGNVTVAPNDGDRLALSVLWGSCPAAIR